MPFLAHKAPSPVGDLSCRPPAGPGVPPLVSRASSMQPLYERVTSHVIVSFLPLPQLHKSHRKLRNVMTQAVSSHWAPNTPHRTDGQLPADSSRGVAPGRCMRPRRRACGLWPHYFLGPQRCFLVHPGRSHISHGWKSDFLNGNTTRDS